MPRPKGSKNKRTLGVPAELDRLLGGVDPAQVLAAVYSMPLDELERLVRSKARAAALGFKLRAAEAAMPYVHSKMPVKVDVTDERLPTLVIVQGTDQKAMAIQSLIDRVAVRRDDGRETVEVKPNDNKYIEGQNR